jgi:hypothetical protein
MYKNSVFTTRETYYVSAAEINPLMLFREKILVYCENRKKHANTLRGGAFQDAKARGTYSTTGLWSDNTQGLCGVLLADFAPDQYYKHFSLWMSVTPSVF